jgi:4-hydroxybenzoate polyprenyltransferase
MSDNHAKKGLGYRRNALLVLNLSRPRTWVFAISSFLLAYLRYGGIASYAIVPGIVTTALVSGTTNLVNAYTDREEDALNQPLRASWVLELGGQNILISSVSLYAAAFLSAITLGFPFTAISVLAIFDSIAYSLPPLRLKARVIPGLLSFSGAVGLAFLGGEVTTGNFNLLDPVFWLVTCFMLSYGAVKNLPDYPGDRRAGIRTTATLFKSIREAAIATCVLLLLPYALLVALVLAGGLPQLFLADLLMVPIPIGLCLRSSVARHTASLERLHTIGFVYATAFINFNFLLCIPSMIAATSVAAIYIHLLLVGKLAIDSRKEYDFPLEVKNYSVGMPETTTPLPVSS